MSLLFPMLKIRLVLVKMLLVKMSIFMGLMQVTLMMKMVKSSTLPQHGGHKDAAADVPKPRNP